MKFKADAGIVSLKIGVCLLIATGHLSAQQADSVFASADTLTAVVRAYESNRPVEKIPAAISTITSNQLQRFANTSLVNAVNMAAGVRMEERSPGSYRINMRGSSLRAPFGIRNVKVYYNDIPFTDPGGNTYLNQLDFRNIESIELVKGPASSLYGAGSGGAILLHTLDASLQNRVQAELSGGSYGLRMANATAYFGNQDVANKLQFTHQQSDGWRNHTAMRRDVFAYETKINISNKQSLQAVLLYGDLYYQTPGALTLTQFKANPRNARPAAGVFPSAETAKASINQQSFLAGFTNEYRISRGWKNTTALYGAASWFKNPTFRLYEKRTEPHMGIRSVFANDFNIGKTLFHLVYGAEAQKGIFTSSTFKNKAGIPDSILTNDEINNWRYSIFAQAEWLFGKGWNITAGLSYNHAYAGIQRLLIYPVTLKERTFKSDIAPRVALMKSFDALNIYATVSQGFSPPATSELLPGTGIINTTLKAERGINYEAGVKGKLKRLSYDIAVYHFNVTDAISQRRDASGGDYYENAGKTKQQGIEISASYALIKNKNSFVSNLNVYSAYTGNFYSYSDYKVISQDYSGKQLPGIPKHNVVFAADAQLHSVYVNVTYQGVDKIAMNDANSEYADAYHLLSARVGYKFNITQKHSLELFAATDNLLDEVYSLGNDINAAAGRYYNAAQKRNFTIGLRYHSNTNKAK